MRPMQIIATGFACSVISFSTAAIAQECTTVLECAQQAAKAADEARQLMNLLVPAGAVVAFATDTCPIGWTAYEPARGRFIRGIDPRGENDSVRAHGSVQTDAFQGHWHAMDDGGAPGLYDSTQGAGELKRAATTNYSNRRVFRILDPIKGSNGDVRVADETRPKNVALLYCKRD